MNRRSGWDLRRPDRAMHGDASLSIRKGIKQEIGPLSQRVLCRQLVLLAALAFGAASQVGAAAVTYTVSNVAGSEWQYNYSLSGSYTAGEDLAIYFPYSSSSTLTDLGTGGTSWSTFVLQPDVALSANGEFDLMALSANPSLTTVFSVTFLYSGNGLPAAQAFTLFDATFTPVQTGTTSAASVSSVPEPSLRGLFCLGMLLACAAGLRAERDLKKRLGTAIPLAMLLLALGSSPTLYAQGPPGGGMPPGGTPPGGGTGPGGGGGGTTTALAGITIGPYVLQSSSRYSQYQYNYTYTTTAINANATPYSSVLGTVTSSSANTVVVAGTVEFGNVAAASTATGLTTFTIRQDRRYAFDPSNLSWAFSGAASSSTIGTTASAVSVSASSSSVTYGTGISMTATVSPATGSGTVTFYDDSTALGTANVSSGLATLNSFVLPTGSHAVRAVYSGDTTYAASSSGASAVEVLSGGDSAVCSGLDETPKVVCLANAFEATLTSAQIATLQLDYTLANVEHWSNLPLGIVARNGLGFGTLTSIQLAAALQLAQAVLSPEGYQRLQLVRGADDLLNAANTGFGWGSGNYFIAFDGMPSTTSPWMLQINGHHFAWNHTFNGNYASASPYFLGIEPVIYNVGPSSYLPMEKQRSAIYPLMQSLVGTSSALLSGTFDDVVMGVGSGGVDTNYPQSYPSGSTGRGIPFPSLSAAQQALVKQVIEAWVNDADRTTASTLLSAYEDSNALSSVYVGYAGGGSLATQGDYLRIDGPRVWIEFCVQNGIAWPASYHFHTIWRDKTSDYGGDFQ